MNDALCLKGNGDIVLKACICSSRISDFQKRMAMEKQPKFPSMHQWEIKYISIQGIMSPEYQQF